MIGLIRIFQAMLGAGAEDLPVSRAEGVLLLRHYHAIPGLHLAFGDGLYYRGVPITMFVVSS